MPATGTRDISGVNATRKGVSGVFKVALVAPTIGISTWRFKDRKDLLVREAIAHKSVAHLV